MRILILILLWPVLEIAVFMAVGDEIGFFNAFLLCFASAILGGVLVQQQGLKTALAIQDSLNRGVMPMDEIFTAICLFLAGILLILPGFISDGLAVLLLIPQARKLLREKAGRHLDGAPGSAQTDVIDAEFIEIKSEEIREAPPQLGSERSD